MFLLVRELFLIYFLWSSIFSIMWLEPTEKILKNSFSFRSQSERRWDNERFVNLMFFVTYSNTIHERFARKKMCPVLQCIIEWFSICNSSERFSWQSWNFFHTQRHVCFSCLLKVTLIIVLLHRRFKLSFTIDNHTYVRQKRWTIYAEIYK